MGLRKLGLVMLAAAAQAFASVSFEPLAELPREIPFAPEQAPIGPFPHEQRFEFSLPRFEPVASGQWEVILGPDEFGERRTLYAESVPALPFYQKRISLGEGGQPTPYLTRVEVDRTRQSLPLAKVPEPYQWSPDGGLEFGPSHTGRYFPGKLWEYKQADDALYLYVYPVQYDRRTGELLAVRSAEFKMDFAWRDDASPPESPARSPEALILTTEALRDGAELLRDFHAAEFSTTSEIVTVEEIARREKPVDESTLPDGYKDGEGTSEVIRPYDSRTGQGYHYELARKIISHLRKRMGPGQSLKYVTLLGTARMIPPSYYFSFRGAFNGEFGVTDQCYAADKLCLEPQLAVGRLPFETREEVDQYLTKLERWLGYSRRTAGELALYGGKAFPGNHYIGELATLSLLEFPDAGWREVQKFFRTAGNYTKNALERMVQGQERSPFVYHLDHGKGNQWFVERDFLSSREVMALKGAGREVQPYVVSIACSNAAFDRALMKEIDFGPSRYGRLSVGEALLKSPAGAVAFLGAPRVSLGQPLYQVDEAGNLKLRGTTYQLQMMDAFFRRYHDQLGGRVGDLLKHALRSYVYELGNDMANPKHLWTYFNVALLGDPVVKLPDRRHFDPSDDTAVSVTRFHRILPWGFPRFVLGDAEDSLSVEVRAPAATIASLLRMDPYGNREKLVQRHEGVGDIALALDARSAEAEGIYLLRLENRDGVPRESRVWFHVESE